MDAPTAAGMALGVVADRLLGDPRRGHPVAGFGAAAAALERRTWRNSRTAGAVHTGALTLAAAGLGVLLRQGTRRRPAHFGWAAARLDDVANWAPARLTAALTVACAPLVDGSAGGALRVWIRDGASHPAPTPAGARPPWPEPSGCGHGGRNVYGSYLRVAVREPAVSRAFAADLTELLRVRP